jgi:ABC-2 type transport system permease protein
MKFVDVMMKGLKGTFRDRKGLAFMLLFPVMFMFIFRVSFGWGAPENSTYDIAVLDQDTGEGPWDTASPSWMATVNAAMHTDMTAPEFFGAFVLNGTADAGDQYVSQVLAKAMYDDGKTVLFKIKNVTTYDEGQELVRKGDASAMLIIPANFTSAVQGAVDSAIVKELRAHSIAVPDPLEGYANATVDIAGVTGSMDYAFANGMLQGYTGAYTQIVAARTGQMVSGVLGLGPLPKMGSEIGVAWVSMGDTGEFTAFDWIGPGIMVFGLMMTAQWVTGSLSTEVKDRTINRLRLTKMTALDLMLGETMRWMVMGVIVTVLLFAVAIGVGMHYAGDPAINVPLAIVNGLLIVLASIALGLILAAFVNNPDQATGLATLIIVPMTFFTGVFFDLDLAATRYFPWTQGATAMRQMLIFDNMDEALTAMGYCFVGAMVLFAIGVLAFHFKRLRSG